MKALTDSTGTQAISIFDKDRCNYKWLPLTTPQQPNSVIGVKEVWFDTIDNEIAAEYSEAFPGAKDRYKVYYQPIEQSKENHIPQSGKMVDDLTSVLPIADKWITDKLPDNNKPVWAFSKALNGSLIPCVAQYTKGWDLEVDIEDGSGDLNFDHNNEKAFMKQGWYENCEQMGGYYDEIFIPRTIVAWKPIITTKYPTPELTEGAEEESVEQAAESYAVRRGHTVGTIGFMHCEKDFIAAANWQNHQSNQEVVVFMQSRIVDFEKYLRVCTNSTAKAKYRYTLKVLKSILTDLLTTIKDGR